MGFNNYKIVSQIGEGGMAKVYLAEHVLLGHQVAIKSLKEDYLLSDKIRKRFIAEARNMA